MKKRFFFSLFAAAIVTFSLLSCTEKSVDEQDNPGGGGGGGEDDTPSLHLTKIVNQEHSEYYGGGDLMFTYGEDVYGSVFQWQGNRVSDYLYLGFENGMMNEEPSGLRFTYEGNVLTEISDMFDVSLRFTYENGRLAELNYMESGNDWTKMRPTYDDNGTIPEVIFTHSNGDIDRFVMTWTDDNITTLQHYENGSLESTVNYTYDNKHSAYSSVPLWYTFLTQDFFLLSANNVESAANGSNVHTYTYTYHDDYPVMCECLQTESVIGEFTIRRNLTTYFEYDGSGMPTSPQFYEVGAENEINTNGTVFGGGIYPEGSTAVFFAEANNGYDFVSWGDGNTDNPRSVTVTENATYTAVFSNGSNPPEQASFTAVFDGTELDVSGYLDGQCSNTSGQLLWLIQAAYRLEGNSVYFPYVVCWFVGETASEFDLWGDDIELYYETSYQASGTNYGDWQHYSTNYINVTDFDLENHTLSFTASFEMYSMKDIVENGAESPDEATKKTLVITVNNLVCTDASKGSPKKLHPKK